mmetsp:Transcript_18265/g.62959  ORF Transcript_18265/g.62959 Transcript_18265/m.62959 type:complete len:224 (+) Transcript_18265:620-1291(+)
MRGPTTISRGAGGAADVTCGKRARLRGAPGRGAPSEGRLLEGASNEISVGVRGSFRRRAPGTVPFESMGPCATTVACLHGTRADGRLETPGPAASRGAWFRSSAIPSGPCVVFYGPQRGFASDVCIRPSERTAREAFETWRRRPLCLWVFDGCRTGWRRCSCVGASPARVAGRSGDFAPSDFRRRPAGKVARSPNILTCITPKRNGLRWTNVRHLSPCLKIRV